MWATLTPVVLLFTLPTYSSISLGLLPAASTRVGWEINVGGMSLLARESHCLYMRTCAPDKRRLIAPLHRTWRHELILATHLQWNTGGRLPCAMPPGAVRL